MRDSVFADGVADIRVSIGYSDHPGSHYIGTPREPSVAHDAEIAKGLGNELAKMGFRALSDDEVRRSPLKFSDGVRARVKVYRKDLESGRSSYVSIMTSANSPDHERNVGIFGGQGAASKASLEFMRASASADVFLYLGHSRKVYGPDPNPPKAVPRRPTTEDPYVSNYVVQYQSYIANGSGFFEALRKSEDPAKLVGLLSCSTNVFEPTLREAVCRRPATRALVLSTRPTETTVDAADPSEDVKAAAEIVKGVIGRDSTQDFNRKLKACSNGAYVAETIGGTHVPASKRPSKD